jgi:hypothetical protein
MSLRVKISQGSYNSVDGMDAMFKALLQEDFTATAKKKVGDFIGILQNDITFGYNNSWSSTAMNSVEDTAASVGGNVVGAILTAVLGMTKAVATMAGYSLGTVGAASNKTYNGTNIDSFTLEVKWITKLNNNDSRPVSETYLKNLVTMSFPEGIANSWEKPDPITKADFEALKGVGMTNIQPLVSLIVKAEDNVMYLMKKSIARPPTLVNVEIINSAGVPIYKFNNYVISSLKLFGSRETYNGVSLVMGATISFEIFQTPSITPIDRMAGTGDDHIVFNKVKVL